MYGPNNQPLCASCGVGVGESLAPVSRELPDTDDAAARFLDVVQVVAVACYNRGFNELNAEERDIIWWPLRVLFAAVGARQVVA